MSTALAPALVQAMLKPVSLVSPRPGEYYTPVFRGSFPTLDIPGTMPDAPPGAKASFSIMSIFDPDADLSNLKNAVDTLMRAKLGPNFAEVVAAGSARYPLRPQVIKAYAGMQGRGMFASLRAQQSAPPTVVDMSRGGSIEIPTGQKDAICYAGSYCYALVSPYWYAKGGGQGVSLSLRMLVKVADGEPLGGPPSMPVEQARASLVPIAGLVTAPAGEATMRDVTPQVTIIAPNAQGRVVAPQASEEDKAALAALMGQS